MDLQGRDPDDEWGMTTQGCELEISLPMPAAKEAVVLCKLNTKDSKLVKSPGFKHKLISDLNTSVGDVEAMMGSLRGRGMQEESPSDFMKMSRASEKGGFIPGELDDSILKRSVNLYD